MFTPWSCVDIWIDLSLGTIRGPIEECYVFFSAVSDVNSCSNGRVTFDL